MSDECDLLVVGGGPAGLTAAMTGASEGLRVKLIDSGPGLGGQASQTSLIENYPGFPDGISGQDLLGHFVSQAVKFDADLICPQTAVSLRADGPMRIITTDDDQVFQAKTVILALGLSYRKLGCKGIAAYVGREVRYGSPTRNPLSYEEKIICIVGGANSAAQAATYLAQNAKVKVKMIVRNKLGVGMSQFLHDRIKEMSNIEVLEGAEVIEVLGNGKLQSLCLQQNGSLIDMPADYMFIFIGAAPKTFWLQGSVAMDEKNFILTGPKLLTAEKWKEQRQPLPFETSMPGVFACGDVRLSSVKRFASAVGEGTTALSMCHTYRQLINNH